MWRRSVHQMKGVTIASCSVCASVMRCDVLAPYMRLHPSFEKNRKQSSASGCVAQVLLLSLLVACTVIFLALTAASTEDTGGGEEVGGWDEEGKNRACHTCMCCLPPNLFSLLA